MGWNILTTAVLALTGNAIREHETEKRHAERMHRLSLTCRYCKELAPPIEGTKNRYRCQCGRQFSGARHHM